MSSVTEARDGIGIYAITEAAHNHRLNEPIDESTDE